MAEIDAGIPERALAVYAHPDDPEVSCAGTLARWARGGAEVRLVICTRGEKGTTDPTADPEELASTRAAEVAAACDVLGIAGHEVLGYPDGELENDAELREQLVARVRSARPDVVVCPDPTAVFFGAGYVNHHDHRSVGWATLDACAPAAASPLYFPAAGAPHAVGAVLLSGTLEPDTWIDVSNVLDVKGAALACHRTQLGDAAPSAPELVRARAEDAAIAYVQAGGRPGALRHAESFRRLLLS